MLDEFLALGGGVVDASGFDGFVILAGLIEGAEEAGGKVTSGSQFRHSGHSADGGDGHDAGDDGDVDPGEGATIPVVKEVVIIEEELGADVVRPGIDLLLEVVHFLESILGGGVSFRKAGDADGEGVGVFLDEADEVGGEAEVIVTAIVVRVVTGGVASQGEDGLDTVGLVAVEDFGHFLPGVSDAGEMGDGGDAGFLEDALDDISGAGAGGSSGAVGDAHEGRVERGEVVDGA